MSSTSTTGELSQGHGHQLLRLDGPERQISTARIAIAEHMSTVMLSQFIDLGRAMTHLEGVAAEAEIRKQLDNMEQLLIEIAKHTRTIVATLTPEQLKAWATSRKISQAELAAILLYKRGPAPEILFPVILRRLTDDR